MGSGFLLIGHSYVSPLCGNFQYFNWAFFLSPPGASQPIPFHSLPFSIFLCFGRSPSFFLPQCPLSLLSMLLSPLSSFSFLRFLSQSTTPSVQHIPYDETINQFRRKSGLMSHMGGSVGKQGSRHPLVVGASASRSNSFRSNQIESFFLSLSS